MAIPSQTATPKPPVFNVHQLDAADTVDDLNTWAISLLSPNFDAHRPAFKEDSDGIRAWQQGLFGRAPIQVGAWIVLDAFAQIRIIGDAEFQQMFQING